MNSYYVRKVITDSESMSVVIKRVERLKVLIDYYKLLLTDYKTLIEKTTLHSEDGTLDIVDYENFGDLEKDADRFCGYIEYSEIFDDMEFKLDIACYRLQEAINTLSKKRSIVLLYGKGYPSKRHEVDLYWGSKVVLPKEEEED